VVVFPDGTASYFEQFTATLQLDFDFRHFPFDEQEFVVRLDLAYPADFYRFSELEGYSEISGDHGEDEFIIDDFETSVTSVQSNSGLNTSRFTFSFSAPRHLSYYILQIFLPIILIVGVSWFTFFLRDYTHRIEVASANLLLFIAFSFSLSSNYPRLGYLTFLDVVMTVTFVVNALVVMYNVYLRRLEKNGEAERADSIDRYLDWLYPLAYIVPVGLAVLLFF
jgi:hypothetical protein